MKFNPKKHNRRSIRLKEYDYSRAGLYFITLCCQNMQHLFGRIENGEITLSTFGLIIKEEWEKTPQIRNNTALHEYIIMPNHFHAIIEILFSMNPKKPIEAGSGRGGSGAGFASPSQTIGAIIRGFKGATTKRIKEIIRASDRTGESQFAPTPGESQFAPTQFAPTIDLSRSIWQHNYYEHIIRNQQSYQRIAKYIQDNPTKWHDDNFFQK